MNIVGRQLALLSSLHGSLKGVEIDASPFYVGNYQKKQKDARGVADYPLYIYNTNFLLGDTTIKPLRP